MEKINPGLPATKEGNKMSKENHLSWRFHDLWSLVEDYFEDVLHKDTPSEITIAFSELHADYEKLERNIELMHSFVKGTLSIDSKEVRTNE